MSRFTLTFKTPDVTSGLDIADEDEREAMTNLIDKFVEYGEYVSIECDTDKGTALVLKR